mmetsp:Transcript_24562/g.64703  ORF Transcript_24562/g.64703 Transcript_24562/m.64703 type:complete len:160 (-) Transcript_24562:85-564(-)
MVTIKPKRNARKQTARSCSSRASLTSHPESCPTPDASRTEALRDAGPLSSAPVADHPAGENAALPSSTTVEGRRIEPEYFRQCSRPVTPEHKAPSTAPARFRNPFERFLEKLTSSKDPSIETSPPNAISPANLMLPLRLSTSPEAGLESPVGHRAGKTR